MFTKNAFYDQFYFPVIWNSVSLAIYSSSQFDFSRQVMVGNKPLNRATAYYKSEVNDPGKTAI